MVLEAIEWLVNSSENHSSAVFVLRLCNSKWQRGRDNLGDEDAGMSDCRTNQNYPYKSTKHSLRDIWGVNSCWKSVTLISIGFWNRVVDTGNVLWVLRMEVAECTRIWWFSHSLWDGWHDAHCNLSLMILLTSFPLPSFTPQYPMIMRLFFEDDFVSQSNQETGA
jgi:hypothetical protein